eukprot:scaffold1690_cov182-Amphora_coffeaeformis.AAC.13
MARKNATMYSVFRQFRQPLDKSSIYDSPSSMRTMDLKILHGREVCIFYWDRLTVKETCHSTPMPDARQEWAGMGVSSCFRERSEGFKRGKCPPHRSRVLLQQVCVFEP